MILLFKSFIIADLWFDLAVLVETRKLGESQICTIASIGNPRRRPVTAAVST